MYLGLDPAEINRSLRLIFREFERLMEEPVSRRVLTRAKEQARGWIVLGLESMSNRMTRLAKQESYFGRVISLDETIAEFEAVTAEDIQSYASEFLQPDLFSRILLMPEA